jgi:hypothetical protein
MPTLRAPHLDHVPDFFRWHCNDAHEGEKDGYLQAAYLLAGALLSVRPDGCRVEEWDRELTALGELVLPSSMGNVIDVTADNDDAILRWFDDHLPACMELVPRQRRDQFLAGVLRAVDEGIIELG